MRSVLANVPGVDGSALLSELERRLRSGDATSFIAVVPTRRRVNLQRRQWLRAAPHQSTPRLPVFTLSDLVALIAEQVLPARRMVTEELQFALLEQTVRVTPLRYFTRHHRTLPRGTMQTILNTIIKLKEAGTGPEKLREKLDHIDGRDNDKVADIATLYDAYEAKLDGKFRDLPGTLLELNRVLKTEQLGPMLERVLPGWAGAKDRMIVVEGFSEFRKPECEFLSHCAALTNVAAVIISDYAAGNPNLYGHLAEHLDNLQGSGFPRRFTIEEDLVPWKRLVQNMLFSDAVAHPHTDDRVLYVPARNRAEEATLIARIVKGLVKEHPARDLSKICVATRLPGNYTSLFREAFADAGIPVNITDRFALAESAVAVGFVALLDLRLRDFRTRDVARALASPYFTFTHPNGRAVDAENLLSVAAQLRIVGSRTAWSERIATHRALLERGDDDGEGADTESLIAASTAALDDLDLLGEKIDPLGVACPPREFKRRIDDLLRTCGTANNILSGAHIDADLLERETRAFAKLRDVVNDVCDVLADQQDRRDEPIELADYARQIRAAITVARYNVRPRPGKGVLVTSPEETRGLDIDVMIIAGLVDGEFPLPYAPEVFLSKNLQTSRLRHAQDERYLFYQTVTNWSERLVLTSPRTEDTGKEIVPSSFIDALREHVTFGGTLPDGAETDIIARSALHRTLGDRAAAGAAMPVDETLASLVASVGARVDIEKRRHAHTAPEYEGMIAAALTDEQREQIRIMRQRVWSSSQLEQYGRCPFQYFSARMLGLQEEQTSEEGLSAQERGTLLHGILFKFFLQRRERGAPALARASDAEMAEAEREILAIAADEVDRLHIHHPFWRLDIDRLLGLAGNYGVLHRFIRHERERAARAEPAYFELRFGSAPGAYGRSDTRFYSDLPVEFDGWTLRGKIDRIDATASAFAIVDYKTGKAPPRSEIENGTSLQLPLYIRALEQLCERHPEIGQGRSVAGGTYYSLKGDCEVTGGLLRPESAPEILGDDFKPRRAIDEETYTGDVEAAFNHVANYLAGIADGAFPLTSPELRTKVCSYCTFINMCRVRDDVGGLAESEPQPNNES